VSPEDMSWICRRQAVLRRGQGAGQPATVAHLPVGVAECRSGDRRGAATRESVGSVGPSDGGARSIAKPFPVGVLAAAIRLDTPGPVFFTGNGSPRTVGSSGCISSVRCGRTLMSASTRPARFSSSSPMNIELLSPRQAVSTGVTGRVADQRPQLGDAEEAISRTGRRYWTCTSS
jgi:hypothetical protein